VVKVYQVEDFRSNKHISQRRHLYLASDHVEVNIIDSSDIRAAIEELRLIQLDFEQRLNQD